MGKTKLTFLKQVICIKVEIYQNKFFKKRANLGGSNVGFSKIGHRHTDLTQHLFTATSFFTKATGTDQYGQATHPTSIFLTSTFGDSRNNV